MVSWTHTDGASRSAIRDVLQVRPSKVAEAARSRLPDRSYQLVGAVVRQRG